MLWKAGRERVLQEADDRLVVMQTAMREGMTDVYVTLKRIRRRGPSARIVTPKRIAPTFDALWQKLDSWERKFPGQVRTIGADR